MTGLEAVVDITNDLAMANQREKEIILDIIKEPDLKHENHHISKINRIVQSMTLRAMANTQRHYEIYYINTVPGIDQATLERLFEDSPQTAADLIRDRGTKLYSDRIGKATQVIT
jgi:hypothetical protein